ncbi:MAG TPA: hypothetical protein VN698_16085 [Bacteroidia bacterium]|nr:hypothetical protein [Bacteroidia bacterium]
MKKFIKTFVIIAIATNSVAQTSSLKIAEKVNVVKTIAHEQMPATRVFLAKPKNYTLLASEYGFITDDGMALKVWEERSKNFEDTRHKFMQGVFNIADNDNGTYSINNFTLGDYQAIQAFIPGYDKKPDAMYMYFGNDDFTVGMAGVVLKNNAASQKQMLDIMLSAYVDTNSIADPSIFSNFTINLNGTTFKFYDFNDGLFSYTTKGANFKLVPDVSIFHIINADVATYANERKELIQKTILEIEDDGKKVSNLQLESVIINGLPAYEASYTITNEAGNSYKSYEAVLSTANVTYIFRGEASDNKEESLLEIKKIAHSFKMK